MLNQNSLINKPKNNKKLEFTNLIEVKNLCFNYETNKKLILNKINFEIKKGDRVGIIGKTGCGKSTFWIF